MSQNGAEASKSPSAGRPRHQITRSISEISSPISRLHRHNSNRVLKDRERETLSPVVQSTVPGPQGRRSFEVPRFEGVTPNGSPNGSRRTSILYNSADDVMPGILGGSPQKASGGPTTATVSTAALPAPTSVSAPTSIKRFTREKDFAWEQQKAIARKSGLQRSLVELEAFAGSTTARLNDTYYSVLEKLGTLQNTVSALKELAELSGQINNTFSTDADGLFDDFSSQLDSLGHFEDQQERILSLQGRIHTGRENIRLLSERVDVVRERIENWERAERVWQEKTRKRLKAVWVISIIAALLLILLFIMAKYASESLDVTAANLANDKAGLGNHGRSEPNSEISKTETADRVLNWTGPSESSSSLANEVLRAFDEL